uniref:Response regulator receiver protein n=1 Tax=uncultured bacterium W4-21b TaxID=1130993 RepID=H9BWP0_9BACT|nr:response regulator receiver protein [uncultured bacterium W4-21b]
MAITILLVDDEVELLGALQVLLEDLGYHVLTAADGNSALAIAKEKQPDVMVLDINMPKKSGEDVLQELSGLGLKTKVIVSTGYTTRDQTMKDRVLKRFPVAAFLEKPTGADEMDFVIKEVLQEK